MIELTNEERQVCEVYTRVMGYHRPVAYFNVGKQAEHRERKFFATAATEARLKEMA
jgi:anaerobic ribonucleoside-triphosphate reductase